MVQPKLKTQFTPPDPSHLEDDKQTPLHKRVADGGHTLPIQREHVVVLRHLSRVARDPERSLVHVRDCEVEAAKGLHQR